VSGIYINDDLDPINPLYDCMKDYESILNSLTNYVAKSGLKSNLYLIQKRICWPYCTYASTANGQIAAISR